MGDRPRSGAARRPGGDQRQHGCDARRQHRLAAAGALIQRMRAPSALIRDARTRPRRAGSRQSSGGTPPIRPVWARARRRPRGAGPARAGRARGRAQPPPRSPAGRAMRAAAPWRRCRSARSGPCPRPDAPRPADGAWSSPPAPTTQTRPLRCEDVEQRCRGGSVIPGREIRRRSLVVGSRRRREAVERRGDAAREREANPVEPHLDAGQGAGEHQIVEIAQVADPEHPPGELAETVAERQVVTLEDGRAQRVGIEALRAPAPRSASSSTRAIQAQQLEAPGAHRPARRLGVARMAREHLLEPLLLQHRAPRAGRRAGWSLAYRETRPWHSRSASAASPNRTWAGGRSWRRPAPSRRAH